MEGQLPTVLSLPNSLPYPITIYLTDLKPGDAVVRGQIILRYRYASTRDETGRRKDKPEEMWATWESSVDGEIVQWDEGIKNRMVIQGPGHPIIHIQQLCSHPVIVEGLCVYCCKEATQNDYMSAPAYANNANDGQSMAGPSRSSDHPSGSSLQITHDMLSLRVSPEEAHRLALESRSRLLKGKKLILVVDLDLTIVHAVADPTVGEWMDEIGGPEMGLVDVSPKNTSGPGRGKSQGSRGDTARVDKGKSKANLSSDEQALQDVYRFELIDGSSHHPRRDVKPGFISSTSPDAIVHRNWYYIKPRPGLPSFLETMSQLFEMHVYTAGSRSYADAVCRCIDPTGKYFNERILSRDESGSAASKDLKRLFPTDQSMVVVIDDRWEVWNHGPNLVKVKPFDFFAGLGDINGAFVEPRATDSPNGSASNQTELLVAESTPTEGSLDTSDLCAIKQAQDIEAQVEARPLKRKQEEMAQDVEADADNANQAIVSPASAESPEHKPAQRRAVLKNDDTELQRLDRILGNIHGRFFAEFAKHGGGGHRVAPSADPNPKILFDVRHIIPHLKRKVFAGCVMVFSGIVSIGQRPENNEWWFLASMFGARCVERLGPTVTHVITAKPDTQKVYEALRMPSVKVVHKAWLVESLDLWERLPEEAFLVRLPGKPELVAPRTPDASDPLHVIVQQGEGSNSHLEDLAAREEQEESDEEELVPTPGQPVELEQADFDEMDAELLEFLGSDGGDSSESGSSSGTSGSRDTGDGANSAALASPSHTRTSPVKSSLRRTYSQSSSMGGSVQTADGEPLRKRARFEADERSDADNDFVDIMGRQGEEDYDEYVDEGGRGQRGAMLSDGEGDDLEQEQDNGGMDREMEERAGI